MPHTAYGPTSLTVFTASENVESAKTPEYTNVEAGSGYLRGALFLSEDTRVEVDRFFSGSEQSFSTVSVHGDEKRFSVTMYLNPTNLDQAVALRDALTKAIRDVRKEATA
jgi:hypothetical protein